MNLKGLVNKAKCSLGQRKGKDILQAASTSKQTEKDRNVRKPSDI